MVVTILRFGCCSFATQWTRKAEFTAIWMAIHEPTFVAWLDLGARDIGGGKGPYLFPDLNSRSCPSLKLLSRQPWWQMRPVGLGPEYAMELYWDPWGSAWNVYSKGVLLILVSECCQNMGLLNQNSKDFHPVSSKALETGRSGGVGSDRSRKSLRFSCLSCMSVHLICLSYICLSFYYMALSLMSWCDGFLRLTHDLDLHF